MAWACRNGQRSKSDNELGSALYTGGWCPPPWRTTTADCTSRIRAQRERPRKDEGPAVYSADPSASAPNGPYCAPQSRAHLVEGRDGPLQCVEAPSSAQRTPPEVHNRSPGSEPTSVDNVAVARSTCAPRQWAGLLSDNHCAQKALAALLSLH